MLSETVSKALAMTGGPRAQETAKFVSMMDKFFDCLNVSDYNTGRFKRKVFKQPYRSGTDFRLKVCSVCLHNSQFCTYLYNQWLADDFLGYLGEWEDSVKKREGFSKLEKKLMLLSPETLLGLRMTG